MCGYQIQSWRRNRGHQTNNSTISPETLRSRIISEQNAAEESFSVYFKPVELYKCLGVRASRKPLFRANCLRYKLEEKHKRRVQLSVSISRPLDDGPQTMHIFPLYVVLARPVPTTNAEALQSIRYRFKRACKVIAFNVAPTMRSPRARFILPDINKLSTEFKSGSLAILLVSFAGITNQTEIDLTEDHMDSPSNEGYCLMGKTLFDFIHFSKENSPKMSVGGRAQFMSTISLSACYMKLSCSDGEKCLSFRFPHNSEAVVLQQVRVIVTAEELGAKNISPLDVHSYNNTSTDKLPEDQRPRTREVIFFYIYNNDRLHKTQVTEDYTCPFCLLKCASYTGLACHLPASHDLFNYEFRGEGAAYQFVFVSAKFTASSAEVVGRKLYPREKEFNFCRRPMRRKKLERQNQNHAGPLVLDSNEGHDARNQSLLLRRTFVHSRTGQPMALEQVFGDEDSEDEVDDDVADIEDRKRLDRFVDATQHEKLLMHLWNSFKRKQRVVADGHIPWACEAFSTQHRQDFLQSPELRTCWNVFMVKLWEIGLLDAQTMNNCGSILSQMSKRKTD
ncbi:putative transcription factor C2H2 family [Helianthus annuus]|nr:putative transcription factor C2H2 family [Helianthus annuus]